MQVDKARLSFVVPVAALLAGTWLGLQWPALMPATVACGVLAAVSVLLHFIRPKVFVYAFYLFVFSAGWFSATIHGVSNNAYHYGNYLNRVVEESTWLVQVSTPPKYREELISFEAEIKALDSLPVAGKVKVYLNAPYKRPQLAYGDILLLQGRLSPIKPPANPYEFDYRAYLEKQGIGHQFYLYPKQWKEMGSAPGTLQSWAYRLRDQANDEIQSALGDSTLAAITISMVLGDRNFLDTDTRNHFALTGAAHVLAISGLHVGVIFGALLWLWQIVIGKNRHKWARFGLIFMIIWSYALLTGLSPSVLRASTMFSFMLVGLSMRQSGYVLNSLAASAFVLLLLTPDIVYSAGFWLSYSAVAGIVLLYPRIEPLVNIKNKRLRWVWQLLVVSLAAQLATLPITIYLFHQTPVMGLLTNLVVVPAAFVILLAGLVYLAVSWVPVVSAVVAFVLKSAVGITLGFVQWMAALPFAGITGIYITGWELLVWLALLASFTIFLYTRKANYLMLMMASIVILLGFDVLRRYEHLHQQQLTVYSIYDHTAIDIFTATYGIAINDLDRYKDDNTLRNKIQPNRDAHGIKRLLTVNSLAAWPVKSYWTPSGRYYLYGDKRIGIISKISKKNIPEQPLRLDYLLITNNPKTNMEYLGKVYEVQHFIIDRSNEPEKVKNWLNECTGFGLPCHDASREAFVTEIE